MASAWVYQDDKQVKERGADAASWYVGWYNPEGKRRCKSCGPGEAGKRNADKLTPDALQELMQHRSYSTTQRYINIARQMDAAVASLHVPEVLKKRGG